MGLTHARVERRPAQCGLRLAGDEALLAGPRAAGGEAQKGKREGCGRQVADFYRRGAGSGAERGPVGTGSTPQG